MGLPSGKGGLGLSCGEKCHPLELPRCCGEGLGVLRMGRCGRRLAGTSDHCAKAQLSRRGYQDVFLVQYVTKEHPNRQSTPCSREREKKKCFMAVAMLVPCTDGGLWQFVCGLPSMACEAAARCPSPQSSYFQHTCSKRTICSQARSAENAA